MAKSKKKIEIPTMVVASKVKEFVKANGDFNVGGDFVPELNEKVARLISDAAGRCETNSRKTVRAGDL
jgi:hypothetical protein